MDLDMERRHAAEHPIDELLARRWSPRVFADRAVEPEKLRSLMEAVRWSPSCANEQPWNFLVATKDDPADFDAMLACLVEGNQRWAVGAPVLMISVANRNFVKKATPNRHAFHDVGMATACMMIQAISMGLYSHAMAGFSPDKARETFGIPENADAVAAIAVGYLGTPDSLPEDLKKRELTPSPRKPISDFVFHRKWGEKPSWLD
jgi:nitroreductase